jgi:TonB family protein
MAALKEDFMVRISALVLALFASVSLAGAQGQTYKPGNGVTLPAVVKEVHPTYTRKAMDEGIQGHVALKVVVLDSGKVGDVSVTKSLDEGLDQQAVNAAKQWEFKPGTKDGKAVAVEIALEMTFTLK